MRIIYTLTFCAAAIATGCGSKPPDAAPPSAVSLAQPAPLDPADSRKPVAPVAPPPSHDLAAGTVVPVRLASVVDSSQPVTGFLVGAVDSDVKGADGKLAIPEGSQVAIMVREAGKTGAISTLRMGLYTINIAGHQYSLSDGVKDAATVAFTEDAGKGPSHTSVHLQYGNRIDFKLGAPIHLR